MPDSRRATVGGHDFRGYRRLAQSLLADSVKVLRVPRPANRQAGERWAAHHAAELLFWREPRRSIPWCEAAGYDWDVFCSWLTDSGILPREEA